MTAREKLDYRNRAEEDEKLDYRDEITEGKEEHRTEHPNSSYQAANQHMVKFKDELKAINEKTATDFDFRKNPAEYDLAERKEALEAVEQALNKTQWNSKGERWVAAGDIAQNSFQPMYRRIELAEAAAQYRFPNEFLAAMKEEQINYAEENQTEDGTKVLEFHLKDIETAQRLVEHSNRAFQMSPPGSWTTAETSSHSLSTKATRTQMRRSKWEKFWNGELTTTTEKSTGMRTWTEKLRKTTHSSRKATGLKEPLRS